MKTNRYLKAISYNFLFFLISSLAYLILTPLAIRVMGAELYGLWSILFAISQFTNIGTLGIESIVNKFGAEVEDDSLQINRILSSALLIVLGMALVVALLVFALRMVLVSSINPSPVYASQFTSALAVCSVMVSPLFVTRVFRGFFLSRILNRFVRALDLANAILPILGGIIIATYSRSILLMALWNLLISAGLLLCYILAANHLVPLKWMPERATTRRLLGFSGFMFLESSAITLFQKFDRILVGIILGPAAAGVYSVAAGVGSRMSILAGNVSEVLVPYASLKNAAGERDALARTITRVSKYVCVLSAVVGGLLIVWMEEILALWISPGYAAEYSFVFSIMLAAYGMLSLSRPAHQVLIGLGQVKFTSFTYLATTFIMLGGLFYLARRFDLIGSAIANGLMVLLLVMNYYLYQWFNREKGARLWLIDLLYGILPLALALLLVNGQANWPLRVAYSLILTLFAAMLLWRDKYLVTQIKLLITPPSSDQQLTNNDLTPRL